MAVLLPSLVYVKTLGTGETVQCGSVDLTHDIELEYLRVLIYKHGTLAGTEQVRAKVFSDSGYSGLYATSAWANIADIDGLSTYWWGWLRLDFGRQNLSKDGVYAVALETQNYTESASTYLAASLDWPVAQNTAGNAPNRGIMMQIYGYRSLYPR